jgi:hypothetical protein
MMVVVGVARSRVHKDTLLSPSTLKNYGVECMQVCVIPCCYFDVTLSLVACYLVRIDRVMMMISRYTFLRTRIPCLAQARSRTTVKYMQVSVTFLLHSMSICSQKNDDIMMPNGCLVLHFDVSQGHPAGPKHAA